MSSPSTLNRNHDPLGLNYYFELGFLVAKERENFNYDEDDSDFDSDDSSLCQVRWACPHDAQDAHLEILHECASAFTKNSEEVIILQDENEQLDREFDSPESLSWIIQPSDIAVARAGCPPEYEWIGMKVTSPLKTEYDMRDERSNIKWCLAALRMAVRLHVNSTCQFNLFIRPNSGRFELVHAKKLTTLVWLLERELMLRLCPEAGLLGSGRPSPMASNAAIAKLSPEEMVNYPIDDPLLSAIANQHIPRLHEAGMVDRLKRIWGCGDIEHLDTALRHIDGHPLTFAFELSRQKIADDDSKEELVASAAAFRYALWHPYDDLDASLYWGRLILCLGHVIELDSKKFKKLIETLDGLIEGFEDNSVEADSRWRILLDHLGLSEAWSDSWGEIIQEYSPGGKLSPEEIDKHPALGQIPELRMYRLR